MKRNMDGKTDLVLDFLPGKNGKGTLTAWLAGEAIACEKRDITIPKERMAFAESVANNRGGIDKAEVEAELMRLAADRARRNDVEEQTEPDRDLLETMPAVVRREAASMLESPEMLNLILGDIEALGVAGERELSMTTYLVGTSRLLPRPLATIVQGPSSSGKSYVLEKVSSMMPAEAVVYVTQMTPQALFHMEPESLKNRFVVAGERSRKENDDTAEATRALREMLSGGRLSKLMSVKEAGEIVTRLIEQEGPIAYAETTTLSHIFDEDANRCLLLNTDEQPAQTRRILDKLASGYSGISGTASDEIVERHHALQRMLRPHTVVVPFAERLAALLADDRVEARRAFPHLISTVQASALLHQRQRQIDANGRIEATADDYVLASHLLAKPLGRLLGGRLSDPAQRFLERLRSRCGPDDVFTKREAAQRDNASKTSVYGWVGELCDAGILEQAEAGAGRTAAKWRFSEGCEIETAALLPPVEKVFPDQTWNHGNKEETQAT